MQRLELSERTDLEAPRIGQRRLWCDHLLLAAVGLKAFDHIQLHLGGLGGDFIGGSPRLFSRQLVGRHLTCLGYANNIVQEHEEQNQWKTQLDLIQ